MQVFTSYSQFGLWDVEDTNSYPVPDKETDFVIGKKGVVVLLDKEKTVDVSVSHQKLAAAPCCYSRNV